MILYFTGTGNSRLVAEVLARELGEPALSLNQVFKQNQKWEFQSETPYVVVAPIWAWRIPEKVEELLKKGSFQGSKQIYIVATMGEQAGAAEKYCEKIIAGRGMLYKGFSGVRMPDNYSVANRMLPETEAVAEIRKSLPLIRQIAENIRQGRMLPRERRGTGGWLLSGFVNWGFRTFMANSRQFTVSETCVKCGKCVKACPVNNISLETGEIRFANQCMFCLSCINQCPAHAIDYRGKAKQNGYYTCPPLASIIPGGEGLL